MQMDAREDGSVLRSAFENVETPCYVIDEQALERNLKILAGIQESTGCRILLALKGFACFPFFPLIRKYLRGVSASSLHEARLGREEFGGEVHVCAPAYGEQEFSELLRYADHIVFNSFAQWRKFRPYVMQNEGELECGIRVNPEHSEVRTAIYDPCRRHSRLGVTEKEFKSDELEGISGLHFHSLCEMNADALERTLLVVEEKFGSCIDRMKWVNFGGGHHITRKDYYRDSLRRLIVHFKERHQNIRVYLEPGEAIALNTGVLVASVLDVVHNEMDIAILDASASAHMPDVLEMPYRPMIVGAGEPGEHRYNYRLGGPTCLAGDIIGDYSFPEPLEIGTKLVFLDMAHYTIVKNTTFNGVRLPSIASRNASGDIQVIRRFDYDDFKGRLG
jgi:carboxynorspermidine decarboxylase